MAAAAGQGCGLSTLTSSSAAGGGFRAHNSPRSPAPLIESFKTTWPAPALSPAAAAAAPALPKRTVPDHKLRFQLKASFSQGSSIFYPHLKFNPADFKVGLVVRTSDLGLSKEELAVFIEMVGPRFNQGKGTVRFTSERFANRIENKKHLIFQLERLLLESRRISADLAKASPA